MQRSAFIITVLSLFAFLSLALASPLPVQVMNELRETTVEPCAREILVDHNILRREAPTDTESDPDLHILAREHTTFEEDVEELTGEKEVARDTQDLERRLCRGKICV